jgi:hypothetical protein
MIRARGVTLCPCLFFVSVWVPEPQQGEFDNPPSGKSVITTASRPFDTSTENLPPLSSSGVAFELHATACGLCSVPFSASRHRHFCQYEHCVRVGALWGVVMFPSLRVIGCVQ